MFDSSLELIEDIKTYGGTRVRHLVQKKGARANYGNNKPICLACAEGQLDNVKFLIQMGADMFARDCYCFYIAAQKGHLALLEFLMNRCPSVNKIRNRALILASKKRQYHICLYLIFEQGANMAHLVKTRRGKSRQRFINYVVEFGTTEQLKSIYNIGCGNKRYMRAVKKHIPRYVCKKYSKDLVETLQNLEKNYQNIRTGNTTEKG